MTKVNGIPCVVDLDLVMEAVEADDNMGYCIACGDEAYGVEPDAEQYECKSCGRKTVYGAPQLLIYLA